MELENIVANTVYLKARESEYCSTVLHRLNIPKMGFHCGIVGIFWRFVRRLAIVAPSEIYCYPRRINFNMQLLKNGDFEVTDQRQIIHNIGVKCEARLGPPFLLLGRQVVTRSSVALWVIKY